MNLDLDDLERKARDASKETPGWWRRGGIETYHVFCQHDDGLAPEAGRVLLKMNTHFPNAITAEHIAAASPPVVLALIARIRELESESAQRLAMVEDFNAQRVEAGRRILPLERLAKSATAFVEAQGKIATRELLERPDFATSEWEDLVLAVEGAGR